MKNPLSPIQSKHYYILMIMAVFMILISSCSKDKEEEIKPDEVKAIVSEWIDPYSFEQVGGRPLYQYNHIDNNITVDIIEKGKVFAYVCIANVDDPDVTNRQFFPLPHVNGTNNISNSLSNGYVSFRSNYVVTQLATLHYFIYIILPSGYTYPDIDFNNFDEVAAYFKIDKKFLMQV